jgi:hypothetical protein
MASFRSIEQTRNVSDSPSISLENTFHDQSAHDRRTQGETTIKFHYLESSRERFFFILHRRRQRNDDINRYSVSAFLSSLCRREIRL